MTATVISTFAGCGGSSLGYKQAGCDVLAAIEWDDHAAKTYRLNHPTTRMFHGDIGLVTTEALLEATGLAVGELDILDGSPPCQGFSAAGKRALDDPRNVLFQQQLRLIDGLKPKCIVIENVAGMIKGRMKRVAAEIYRSLEDCGYQVSAGMIEAWRFGVAQHRPRVFFVGSRLGRPVLPRPTHRRPVTAKQALADVEPGYVKESKNELFNWFRLNLKPGEKGAHALKRVGGRPGYFNTWMAHPDAPCFTITKMIPFGGVFHWGRRHLTVNEVKVLTGFPADYILPGKFADRWARLGNSVAPPMTRELARQSLLPLLSR